MRADQVFLFKMLEQLDRRVLQNVDDAAQAHWRPTRSCQLSTKVRVHVSICAPRHTSWTGSCDAPGASGVPHEWRLRCDHISVFSESDVQQSEGRTAVVGDEPHRHESEHSCSSRFDSEWMRAPASLQHPSSTDGEPTRAAEVDRSNFRRAVVCVRQMSAHHPHGPCWSFPNLMYSANVNWTFKGMPSTKSTKESCKIIDFITKMYARWQHWRIIAICGYKRLEAATK